MKKRKVCVVTGSRAEYGLLYWVLRDISDSEDLDLQLLVCGMHLSPEFGLTIRQIEADGFVVHKEVEMLLSSDSHTGIAKSMGIGMIGFADAYQTLDPDIIVVLGDRFELLAAASAALVANIPIAHIHGGELTIGAFDDAIRHSITKMSHLHFVSTEEYSRRVIQLGEEPSRVFVVGAPGIDSINRYKLKGRRELESLFGIELGEKSLLVTYHPVTHEPKSAQRSVGNLLSVLRDLEGIRIVFTKANADTEGRLINSMIDEFVHQNIERAVAYESLGQLNYLSTMSHVGGVLGNSSSGIIEAPSLGIGTVNIGDRQSGRVKAESIIDCKDDVESIKRALAELYSEVFLNRIKSIQNPYHLGDASGQIVKKLRTHNIKNIVKKKFFDVVWTSQE